MAKQFSYYDGWQSAVLTCPNCGWSGTFEHGSMEYHDQLQDSSCPCCDPLEAPILAIVDHPTMSETRTNWDKLPDLDKAQLTTRERFLAEFEALKLRDPAQLADIDLPSFTLAWDLDNARPNHTARYETLITLGSKIIVREPASYEGYQRFINVAKLLRARYGDAVRDLIPTRASEQYLYGDSLFAAQRVDAARKEIFSQATRAAE